MSKKNTQTSLSKLKPAQLKKLYNDTFGDTANPEAESDEMITALLEVEAEKSEDSNGLEYGNQDKDKKYPLNKLGTIPENYYAVRHSTNILTSKGRQVEDEDSYRFQVYDKETFENMSRQKEVDGKVYASAFEQLGMNVDVLHKP